MPMLSVNIINIILFIKIKKNIVLVTCRPGQFTCTNGRCISNYRMCDTEDDCGDQSDEQRCGKYYHIIYYLPCLHNITDHITLDD